MSTPLNWGIIGPGAIAHKFATSLNEISCGQVYAVASRNESRAREFANQYHAPAVYDSYLALLQDPKVDAVYIATPHPMHKEWTLNAAQHGKAVLCEKPAALNAADTIEMIEACKTAGVFFLEAFMYRCHTQITKTLELLRDGTIGEVKSIDARFGFYVDRDPNGRLFAPELGGGGILDVGCYPTSFARLIAGYKTGEVLEPVSLKAVGELGPTGVDEFTQAVATFENGIMASLTTSIQLDMPNAATVYGTEGRLVIDEPWQPDFETCHIHIISNDGETTTHTLNPGKSHYAMQAELVAKHIKDGELPYPAMSHADTIGNMLTLDRWLAELT